MSNTFSHDSNARNDERILALRIRHGAAGYGIYFMLLERMRDEAEYMCVKNYNILAFDLRVDAGLLKSVVEDFGLFTFTDDGKRFYSASFLTRMQHQDDVKQKRSQAGKCGGRPRKIKDAETSAPAPAPQRITPVEAPQNLFAGMITDNWIEIMCMRHNKSRPEILEYIDKFRVDCQCRGTVHRDVNDCKRHFNDWLRIIIKNENNEKNRTNTGVLRRGTDVPPATNADYAKPF